MGNVQQQRASKLDRSEYSTLVTLFKGLASQSEGKTMDKTTFLRYFDFPGMFGERLFELFDQKKNHVIDFEEFLNGLEHYLTGSLDDKIQSLFRMYDLTGDNAVSKKELRTMLLSVVSFPTVYDTFEQTVKSNMVSLRERARRNGLEMPSLSDLFGDDTFDTATSVSSPTSNERELEGTKLQEVVERLVEQAFTMCDLDHSGKLDYPQFKTWIESTPNVMLVLEKHFAKHLWVGTDVVETTNDDEEESSTGGGGGTRRGSNAPMVVESCEKCQWTPRFCPSCGSGLSSVSPLTCPQLACGTVLSVGSGALKFCLQCGARWAKKASATTDDDHETPVGAVLPTNVVRKAGVLSKQRKHVKTFKEQFYVLKNNFLYVFDAKDADEVTNENLQPTRIVFLPGLFIEMPLEDLHVDKGHYGILMISHEGESVVYAHSAKERRSWLRALRKGAMSVPFEEHYSIGPCIGRGRFADVFECTSRSDNYTYAVKIVEKAKIDDMDKEEMRAEIAILRLVKHPFIVNFKAVYENQANIFIVLSLHRGGDLLDMIIAHNRPFEEHSVRSLAWKVLHALDYCHSRGIVHRDIKPENILLDNSDDFEFSSVYLTDFGLSKFALPEEKMQIPRGTLAYLAPEVVLCQGYTDAVDVWGCGIIVYLMLSGSLPFYDENRGKLIDSIIDNEPSFDGPTWSGVSPEAVDFVKRMLCKDPRQRMTTEAALKHVWLVDFVGRVTCETNSLMGSQNFLVSSPLNSPHLTPHNSVPDLALNGDSQQ